ncbi:MAG: cupin domain-containing protein [Sphaerotilus natans subsp. sulfidivorans]|uniref:cupin domain-containing protein n=1 Tax=Sphaerotilus sulfidivorans TaxID=639200 RepID=UPI002352E262|nr:cupin domain-containing protein [Sphaerotilus sulfidivorans]MCK6403825.1 cupin domain-containing protein [Sphaerotilus sulfidivorans]
MNCCFIFFHGLYNAIHASKLQFFWNVVLKKANPVDTMNPPFTTSIDPAPAFFLDGDHPWEQVAPGIERKILGHTPELLGAVVRFDQGAGAGTAHAHELHDQVVYVLTGAFDVLVGQTRRVLRAGDAFVAPKTVWHEAIALEPASQLIDMFSPRRDDFFA